MELIGDVIYRLDDMEAEKQEDLEILTQRVKELEEAGTTYNKLRHFYRKIDEVEYELKEIKKSLAFWNWADNKGEELVKHGEV